MLHETPIAGSYDYRVVALFVVIAMLASYAALDLAGRVTAARGHFRAAWLAGGATAMGIGIWSMHYIGMLAFSLPMVVRYDWPTVLLSLLAAIFASFVALFVVSRQTIGALRALGGSLLMGSAIAAMHYIGMEAMRLPAMCHYSAPLVILSFVLAVVISLVALWLTLHFRDEKGAGGWQKLASAVVMGAAIPVMHYTGMAAVTFSASSEIPNLTHAVDVSYLGAAGIVIVTFMVLGMTLITAFVDRRFSAQALELESSEQRYRQLVESAQVILWRRNIRASQFSFVNNEAKTLLGYPVVQWTAIPTFWSDHIHPDDRDRVASCCRAADEGLPKQFEHRMIAANGETVWLKTSVRVAGAGAGGQLVGVMVDITERKQAQEAAEAATGALQRQKAELERSNQELEQFAYVASHDLQEPLRMVSNYTQLLARRYKGKLDSDADDFIGFAVDGAKRMQALISDLLALSRLGSRGAAFAPTDLEAVMKEAIVNLHVAIEESQARIECDTLPTVMADRGQMVQLFQNLIGNAIKYRHSRSPEVHVQAVTNGDSNWTFRITDNGIGFDPKQADRIFMIFQRLHTRQEYTGTGIGLAVCKKIVERHGGKIWADSNPGEGSTFSFTIPHTVAANALSSGNLQTAVV